MQFADMIFQEDAQMFWTESFVPQDIFRPQGILGLPNIFERGTVKCDPARAATVQFKFSV